MKISDNWRAGGGRDLSGLCVYIWDEGFCSLKSSLLGDCEDQLPCFTLMCLFT